MKVVLAVAVENAIAEEIANVMRAKDATKNALAIKNNVNVTLAQKSRIT